MCEYVFVRVHLKGQAFVLIDDRLCKCEFKKRKCINKFLIGSQFKTSVSDFRIRNKETADINERKLRRYRI